jgi:hypothetical protein
MSCQSSGVFLLVRKASHLLSQQESPQHTWGITCQREAAWPGAAKLSFLGMSAPEARASRLGDVVEGARRLPHSMGRPVDGLSM